MNKQSKAGDIINKVYFVSKNEIDLLSNNYFTCINIDTSEYLYKKKKISFKLNKILFEELPLQDKKFLDRIPYVIECDNIKQAKKILVQLDNNNNFIFYLNKKNRFQIIETVKGALFEGLFEIGLAFVIMILAVILGALTKVDMPLELLMFFVVIILGVAIALIYVIVVLVKDKTKLISKLHSQDLRKIFRCVTMNLNKTNAKVDLKNKFNLNDRQIDYILTYKIKDIINNEEQFIEEINKLSE